MRTTLLTTALLVAFSLASHAQTSEHWVHGVTATSGWSDVNKSKASAYDEENGWFNNGPEGDGYLCWAAAASNVISWWQVQSGNFLQNYPTEGIPQGKDAIFSAFNDGFTNKGFDSYWGLRWFMDGAKELYTMETDWEDVFVADIYIDPESTTKGGYYSEILPNVESLMDSFTQFTYSDPYGVVVDDVVPLSVFTSNLVEAIDGGCGVTLGLQGQTYFGGHAITLWGVNVNEKTGYIDRMWVTDSDDFVSCKEGDLGLFELECTVVDKEKETANGLKTYQVYEIRDLVGDQGGVWYHGQDEYIDSFATLKMIPYQGVPEPTTGTLSLLALAGLCARRRRK